MPLYDHKAPELQEALDYARSLFARSRVPALAIHSAQGADHETYGSFYYREVELVVVEENLNGHPVGSRHTVTVWYDINDDVTGEW